MAIEQGLGLLALGYYYYLKNKEKQQFEIGGPNDPNALARQQQANELARQQVIRTVVGQGSFQSDTDPRTFSKGTLIDGNLLIGALTPTQTMKTISKSASARNNQAKDGCAGRKGFEFVATLLAPMKQKPFEVNWTGRYGFVVIDPLAVPAGTPDWARDLMIQTMLSIATYGVSTGLELKSSISAFVIQPKQLTNTRRILTGIQAYQTQNQSSHLPIRGQHTIDSILKYPNSIIYSHECNLFTQSWYKSYQLGTLCKTTDQWGNLVPCVEGVTAIDETVLSEGMISERFYWDGTNNNGEWFSAGQYLVAAWFELVTGLGELGERTDQTQMIKVPTGWSKVAINRA
ncbi:MAG: hypothetical protein VX409_02885 [Verrucomicrobiota bacterium]|nr:hypothetical protein [Verrucomicrobiota bacterium]